MRSNIEMLKIVAFRLGDLRHEVVFLGGAVTSLLVSDPAAAGVRSTEDVDVAVDVASRVEHARLEGRLRELGFEHDRSQGAPVCRWVVGEVKVDVMPTSPELLGFANRWVRPAMLSAEKR